MKPARDIYGNIIGNDPAFFPRREMAQDLQAIGKSEVEIVGEVNHWQEFQKECLDDMIKANSIDELIEFYDDEAREFYDSLPGVAMGYMEIAINLRVRRVKSKHCV
jgi:hypothetical protein